MARRHTRRTNTPTPLLSRLPRRRRQLLQTLLTPPSTRPTRQHMHHLVIRTPTHSPLRVPTEPLRRHIHSPRSQPSPQKIGAADTGGTTNSTTRSTPRNTTTLPRIIRHLLRALLPVHRHHISPRTLHTSTSTQHTRSRSRTRIHRHHLTPRLRHKITQRPRIRNRPTRHPTRRGRVIPDRGSRPTRRSVGVITHIHLSAPTPIPITLVRHPLTSPLPHRGLIARSHPRTVIPRPLILVTQKIFIELRLPLISFPRRHGIHPRITVHPIRKPRRLLSMSRHTQRHRRQQHDDHRHHKPAHEPEHKTTSEKEGGPGKHSPPSPTENG